MLSDGVRPVLDAVEAAMRKVPSCAPAMEVIEEHGVIVVSCDLPDAQREEIHVDVAARRVVIALRGPPAFPLPRPQGAACAEFERSVQLPSEVRPEDAQARLNNGVLEVTLPKRTPGGSSVHQLPAQ